ncbi:MAG: hypothetical protein ACKOED_09590 [Aestuariivirga sp.]|uniref:hypothetical protein n=1 Tax=Aestuariivirga sp. TaxID=2650926 RepID=UPI0038D17CF8
MQEDIDLKLVDLLRVSIALKDALRDLGFRDNVRIDLDREDGLLVLELVSGARHAGAEEWSQHGKPHRNGFNSLKVAGVTYQWPAPELASQALAALRSHVLVSRLPDCANDNHGRQAIARGGYGFDD